MAPADRLARGQGGGGRADLPESYPNWLSGNIHPAISIHARMAAELSSCAQIACGK